MNSNAGWKVAHLANEAEDRTGAGPALSQKLRAFIFTAGFCQQQQRVQVQALELCTMLEAVVAVPQAEDVRGRDAEIERTGKYVCGPQLAELPALPNHCNSSFNSIPSSKDRFAAQHPLAILAPFFTRPGPHSQ